MGKRDYFRNGTIEMIALSLLSESDLYGYQLVQTISARSGGVITIQIGSLYPVLYRLRDDGYISETQVPIGRRKFRVYYHIEPSGVALYQDLLAEHQSFEAALGKILSAPTDPRKEEPSDE
ncbi:MAG: PadR family transcriptional regulator [Acetatifactor sp.]